MDLLFEPLATHPRGHLFLASFLPFPASWEHYLLSSSVSATAILWRVYLQWQGQNDWHTLNLLPDCREKQCNFLKKKCVSCLCDPRTLNIFFLFQNSRMNKIVGKVSNMFSREYWLISNASELTLYMIENLVIRSPFSSVTRNCMDRLQFEDSLEPLLTDRLVVMFWNLAPFYLYFLNFSKVEMMGR